MKQPFTETDVAICQKIYIFTYKYIYRYIYIYIYLNGVWHEIDGRPRGEGGRWKRTISDNRGRGGSKNSTF